MSRFELYPEIVALSTEYHWVLGGATAREHGARLTLVRPADNVVMVETHGECLLIYLDTVNDEEQSGGSDSRGKMRRTLLVCPGETLHLHSAPV